MSVLVGKDTRLLVQGITGSAGGFHAKTADQPCCELSFIELRTL